MKLSNRVLEMEESVTLAAGARAKALKAEGRDILSLTLGEPDFTTPKNIQDAAIASIRDGRASFYTVTSGLPELKAAVNSYFERFYGYSVAPNQVTVVCRSQVFSFILSLWQWSIQVMRLSSQPHTGSAMETRSRWLRVYQSLFLLRKTITLR